MYGIWNERIFSETSQPPKTKTNSQIDPKLSNHKPTNPTKPFSLYPKSQSSVTFSPQLNSLYALNYSNYSIVVMYYIDTNTDTNTRVYTFIVYRLSSSAFGHFFLFLVWRI
ncbi:hypothetical protein BKA69DRAFT_93796 [Paraphysoderma sedebokerense]|nr:hypothetical protein BKA69DRAFT_93796 [Paraphysoderma sedebokerense]